MCEQPPRFFCSLFLLVRALQVTPTVAARKPGRKPKKPKPPFTLSLGVTCDVHAILP